MAGYKRRRTTQGGFLAKRRRFVSGSSRRFPSTLRPSYGPLRTAGNYSQIQRRYDSRFGAMRVGPGPEKKFIDTIGSFTYAFGAGYPASGAVTFQLLNPLAQGTDATSRIGRKIMMKSIFIRNQVQMAATATGGGAILRTLVIYDSQTNGAAPVAADVFQSNAAATLTAAPINLNNRERFLVLWDKTQRIEEQATGPSQAQLKLYKTCNLPVIFNAGNAGTVADIQTGSLYAVTMTNVQTASPVASTWVRVRFLDD